MAAPVRWRVLASRIGMERVMGIEPKLRYLFLAISSISYVLGSPLRVTGV
jgi:hypothetical protein